MARVDRAKAEAPLDAAPGEAAGIYLHLPFCARVCPYCDFAVTVARLPERRRLVEALVCEIDRRARDFPRAVDTIYFGGGTPSLLDPEDLERLVVGLRDSFDVEDNCRIFLEANPEDADPTALAAWRAIGVTTLSLGVQAMDLAVLRFLGRRHTPDQARRAVETALGSGFQTVSIDLIYGRPEQSLDGWLRELDAAAELEPDHFSCYQLTVHAETPFGVRAARGRLMELPDRQQAELFFATHERLAALGWPAYEVSNFAHSMEHRSRHNLKYWGGGPYLGLGPSAHSFASAMRWWNVADAWAYVDRIRRGDSPVEGGELLTSAQELLETVMLGLRTTAGVDLKALEDRFDVAILDRNRRVLDDWERRGWARLERGRVLPSLQGLAIADGLAAALDLPLGVEALAIELASPEPLVRLDRTTA